MDSQKSSSELGTLVSSYCVINFRARSEAEAHRRIKAAEEALNKRAGVDAVLDDEMYLWDDDHEEMGPDQWVPPS